MSFKTDKHTLSDLMIFGRAGQKSLFEIFNRTNTRGASRLLDSMFRTPLSDYQEIKNRVESISFFKNNSIDFPFQSTIFDTIEFYVENTDTRRQISTDEVNLSRKFRNIIGGDSEFAWIQNGVLGCLELLNGTAIIVNALKNSGFADSEGVVAELESLLNDKSFEWYPEYKDVKKISMRNSVNLDKILRFEQGGKIMKILRNIYILDLYISLAHVANERNFTFATPHNADHLILKLKGVYHPLLDKPIGNDLEMGEDANVIFLTGANMAGKSTLMKTLSISLFLAHMGIPVPAVSMDFSVRNGMFTTINLPDDLSRGYSHFYSEVVRIKKIGESLHNTGKLIVIFDELFRGTNVKDAYDATLAVTQAFAKNRDSLFVVSTHITEVGEVLRDKVENIRFLYMPTLMQNNRPVYLYKIAEGITEDRHGMLIVNNEKIVEIIKGEYNDF